MATVYGGVHNYGRAWLDVSSTSNNTQTTFTVTGGYQNQGSRIDLARVQYTLSATGKASSTTTNSVQIPTSAATMRQLGSATYTYQRTHARQYITISGETYTQSSTRPGRSRASFSAYVEPLASYTVSFNANGGSGAPAAQKKWYGERLTLPSTRPTRTGHTFKGWATSSGGAVTYQPGGAYTANAGATLYAIWQQNTFTVSYNANGGTGAPAAQTKTHGVALRLSSTVPTYAGFTFLGWATSSGGAVAYQPGASYTANAGATLYAAWELNTVAIYDGSGNAKRGLVTVYDASGNAKQAKVSVYDASGNVHAAG